MQTRRGPKLQSCKSHLIIWWSYAGRMVHFFPWLIMISSKFKIYAGRSLCCIQFGFQNWWCTGYFGTRGRDIGICRHMNLVQTHKCSFSIMGPHIYDREHSCSGSFVCCCSCCSCWSHFSFLWPYLTFDFSGHLGQNILEISKNIYSFFQLFKTLS